MSTAAVSDIELLAIQIDALFTHDSDGRIRTINEPGSGPAPRFFFGRTSAGNLWRFRYDLSERTVQKLQELAASEPVHADLRTEPRHLETIKEVLGEDQAIHSLHFGPAYHFPDELPLPGDVTRITRDNLQLLRGLGWDLEALAEELEDREPVLARLEGSVAVSLCFCARLTNRCAEAGVETVEAYRGLGYAPTVVAGWARAIRPTGKVPLYSTSWDNSASQAVARKLGLVQYATDLSLD